MTRLVFVNGFLGAGKTTTIAALARRLAARGLAPAVVTNDQAAALVDTETIRLLGVPVSEVTAGCFCCRFSDLVVVLDELLAAAPDVILCEAVGSCTDIVATVIRPLQRFYGDAVSIAPFFVVVDARTYDERVPELRYLREQQLAEADVVLVNKIDLAPALVPGIPISALRGDGLEDVLDLVLGEATAGANPLRDLDYDVYARAEALLAWMNATVRGDVDVRELVAELASLAPAGEALHVKASSGEARAHATRSGEARTAAALPPLSTPAAQPPHCTINARIRCDASTLRAAFERIARESNLEIVTLHAFHPAYPRPERRL